MSEVDSVETWAHPPTLAELQQLLVPIRARGHMGLLPQAMARTHQEQGRPASQAWLNLLGPAWQSFFFFLRRFMF